MKSISEKEKISTYNRKRSSYISFLRRKNVRLSKQIVDYIRNNDISDAAWDLLSKHKKNIGSCSSKSLYGMDAYNNITYVGSHTCKSKLCFVCNWNRQKRTRHKYKEFFELNNFLWQITKGKKKRIVTFTQLEKWEKKGWQREKKVEYDLMHLTLTVPHNKNGWKGEYFFYEEFRKIFREMRRYKFWKDWVYGGEYGLETTKTEDNGLHIHAHALVMVRKVTQNRNKLHKELLRAWNQLTINPDIEPVDFHKPVESVNHKTGEIYYETVAEKIKRSNKRLTDQDIDKLHPQGTRIIRLETIFSMENGEKVRAMDNKATEHAIMEAISYHFEPLMFDKDKDEIDIELLAETAEAIQGKSLYEKFGCLWGEKSLNIIQTKEEKLEDDFSGKEEVEDIEEKEQMLYMVVDPYFVYHDTERDNDIVFSKSIRKRIKTLNARNVNAAIDELAIMIKAELTGN